MNPLKIAKAAWELSGLALPSYHAAPARDAISAELVRLSLPHHPSTDRPELQV